MTHMRRVSGVAWLWLLAAAFAAAGLAGCGTGQADPVAQTEVVRELRKASASDDGADATAAAAVTGTGWGTLRGRFVLVGTPPDPGTVSTGGKDAPTCRDGQPSTSLVVASDGGLANVVLYLRKASRVHESFAEMVQQPTVFDQKQCVFLERVKVVFVGQTMVVKNSDPVAHNTNCSPSGDNKGRFNSQLAAGGSIEVRFGKRQNEPQPVTCNVHSWMKAYIMPRNDPYAVVTAADGTFELPNLPAGEELELQVWHERATGDKGALSGKGSQVSINAKGRFTVTVPADEVLDLGEIRVPATALR